MSSPPFPYRFPIKRVLVVVYSAAKTVRSRPRSFATVSCLFHLRGGYCSRVGLWTGRIFLCLARAKAWFRELPRLGGAPASPSDRCRISQRWTGLGSIANISAQPIEVCFTLASGASNEHAKIQFG